MKLSILIPTLITREHFMREMMAQLEPQMRDGVQVIPLKDNREKSIGEKRNILRSMANGEYSVFIDDDDKVPGYYIEMVMAAIEEKPDVVGIRGIFYKNNRQDRIFTNSLDCDGYTEDRSGFYRCPNHLNPMKTEIAKQVTFEHSNFGEDTNWALALNDLKLLQTEIFIEKPLYYYYFVSRKFY